MSTTMHYTSPLANSGAFIPAPRSADQAWMDALAALDDHYSSVVGEYDMDDMLRRATGTPLPEPEPQPDQHHDQEVLTEARRQILAEYGELILNAPVVDEADLDALADMLDTGALTVDELVIPRPAREILAGLTTWLGPTWQCSKCFGSFPGVPPCPQICNVCAVYAVK